VGWVGGEEQAAQDSRFQPQQLAGKEEAEVDAGEVPEQVDGVPGGGVGAKQLVAEQVAKRTERR